MGFVTKQPNEPTGGVILDNLTRARTIEVFDREGRQMENYKAVVDETDDQKIFGIVSDRYTLVQHEEVVQQVKQTFSEIGIRFNVDKFEEVNNGARLKMGFVFPDFEQEIRRGDSIQMRIDFDNSYNSTTGLRAVIGAYQLVCENGMYVGEKWAIVYHKHTKGVVDLKIGKIMEKAAKRYNEQFLTKMQKMAQIPVTQDQTIAYLDRCLEQGVIPKKYIDEMRNKAENPQELTRHRNPITTEYDLYNIVTETLTHGAPNSDVHQRHVMKMASHMRTNLINFNADGSIRLDA